MRPLLLSNRRLTETWERFQDAADWLLTGATRGSRMPHSVRRVAGGSTGTTIAVLPDPERRIDLVAVGGVLTEPASLELEAVCRRLRGRGVHLDLHAAVIPDVVSMSSLERVIDRIEARGMTVRVRGIDPMHPALEL